MERGESDKGRKDIRRLQLWKNSVDQNRHPRLSLHKIPLELRDLDPAFVNVVEQCAVLLASIFRLFHVEAPVEVIFGAGP